MLHLRHYLNDLDLIKNHAAVVCSRTTNLARNIILALGAQRRPGADHAMVSHKSAARAFAGVAPVRRVQTTRIAHCVHMPIPLFEWHAGEEALVLFYN